MHRSSQLYLLLSVEKLITLEDLVHISKSCHLYRVCSLMVTWQHTNKTYVIVKEQIANNTRIPYTKFCVRYVGEIRLVFFLSCSPFSTIIHSHNGIFFALVNLWWSNSPNMVKYHTFLDLLMIKKNCISFDPYFIFHLLILCRPNCVEYWV